MVAFYFHHFSYEEGPMSKDQGMGTIQLSAAMLISGTIGAFVLASGQSATNSVFFRCLIGGLVLLAYILVKNIHKKANLNKENLPLIIIIGFSIVINWVSLFKSYEYIPIGLSTTVYHAQPFLVFFGGALFLNAPLSRPRLTYILIGFIGLCLVIDPSEHFSWDSNYLLGCSLALIAAFFYALATIATKKLNNVPPHVIALSQLVIGLILLAPLANFSALPDKSSQWAALLVLGIVHSAAMYILIYSAYQKLEAAQIAVLNYLYPLAAVGVDYFYFGITLSTTQLIGGFLILACGLFGMLNLNPLNLLVKARNPS